MIATLWSVMVPSGQCSFLSSMEAPRLWQGWDGPLVSELGPFSSVLEREPSGLNLVLSGLT